MIRRGSARPPQFIETQRDHYDADRRAINEAVDELLHTWQGDSAAAFQTRWYRDGGAPVPAHALAQMTSGLDRFVAQLRDYADQLEHAQHDRWMQMAVLTTMTVVNVAQGDSILRQTRRRFACRRWTP